MLQHKCSDLLEIRAILFLEDLTFEFFHNFSSNSMNSLNCIHSDVSMKYAGHQKIKCNIRTINGLILRHNINK